MSQTDSFIDEIKQFISSVDSLDKDDMLKILTAIYEKHVAMSTSALAIEYKDFHNIVSDAKGLFSTISFPIKIGDQQLYPSENANYCLMSSVISFLIKKEALKKRPLFKKGT